jgi:hypothetical protein
MSTTNSPAFDSNMDPNNVVENSSNETSPVQPTQKMTKKQEKDLERAAKKKAKEDAAAAKELAKKEKEDAKKAKADEKAAKALAKEEAKKDKEEAKAAKELAKKERAEAKLNKANAKKSNASSSQDLPQESSQDLPQESSQDLPQESSQDLPQESSQDLPQESSQNLAQDLAQDLPLDLVQDSSLDLAPQTTDSSSLPAKYNKFFEFAYFLIKLFENSGEFAPEHIKIMNQLALLQPTSPEKTTQLIQSFLDSQKLLSADLKRIRKSSSSKPSSSSNQPDFVSQLVQHALHDQLDLPIRTHPFSFQGQDFLIDDDHNLYHPHSHITLGKWNPLDNLLSLYNN